MKVHLGNEKKAFLSDSGSSGNEVSKLLLNNSGCSWRREQILTHSQLHTVGILHFCREQFVPLLYPVNLAADSYTREIKWSLHNSRLGVVVVGDNICPSVVRILNLFLTIG